jgi:molybdate transport system substrate-binding protein
MPGEALLALLCAGAAKGLVTALAPAFARETGVEIDATFGAVGALVEKLDAGARCDAIVLTAALIARLGREGRVVAGSAAPLGSVPTAIAVRAGAPHPDVRDAETLRATLLRATRLFFPDPERATAGIHFAGVLRRLGIDGEVAARCATFPNGAAAMAALAQPGDPCDVGCTQSTEILATPGVALVGALPPPLDLATVYSIAVGAKASEPAAARRLAQMLCAPEARELRAACGFVPGP